MALTWTHKDRGEIRVHENLEELSIDLVDYIAEISEASIKDHGAFCIVLSGGSLISLMGKLTEPPYNKIVDWAKWYVFWADERVVAKSHDDSNYKLAKDNLLSKVNVFPRHICSINDTVSAEEAATEYEFAIRQMVRTRTVTASDNSDCPKFDLILLGMGSDGHVASLFPNHPALEVKNDWVTFLTDSPKPPPERITFTFPVINSAANVVVVATGESKANAIHLAIDDLTLPDGSFSLPARLVHPSNGNLIWFMDKQAGSELDMFKFSE
ncbi:putative 6-phosphogluconolactonase 1 [Cardamine amara subsp. amara]|uniref:Probable 6-phosphogluconolactonase n=1 Tax=Cardamine amara subsp. amara TaxID=228776 RepID=A0ABD1BS83_CARAN